MFPQAQMQDLIYNTAVLTAAGTLLGAVVVFVLLYMVLERKKKPLIGMFVLMLAAFSAMYWYMGHKAQVSPMDAPKVVKTETIKPSSQVQPTPVPLPKARPRVKKAAKPIGPPLKICP